MADARHRVEWTLAIGAEGGPEVQALGRELGKLDKITAFKALKKQAEESEKAWKDATARVSTMAKELATVERPTKKVAQEFDRAKTEAGKLKDQFERQRLALHNLRTEMNQSGISTTKLVAAQIQAKTRAAALQTTIAASNAELKKTPSATGAATAGMSAMTTGIGGLQTAAAGLLRIAPGGIAALIAGVTGGSVVGKGFEAAKLAADYETMGVAMYVVGRNAGYTRTELNQTEAALRKTGISMQESRNNIAKLVAANIDLDKATTLARIAQDAAVIGQMNSSEAFGALVDGIQSAQVEMLRNLKINVSFEQSYRDMAKQLGKNTTELTEAEKMQARLNIVIKEATGIAGAYEESLETTGKKITSLTRLEDNVTTKIGKIFEPVLAVGVNLYTASLEKLDKVMDNLLAKAADAERRSPLFSGVAGQGLTAATIVGILKLKELFTAKEALEKEAASRSEATEKASAEVIKSIRSQLTAFTNQNLESVLAKVKSTLKEAEAAEKDYAEQVKKYQEQRALAQLSTQEKVRALVRTQMSELDAYRDKQREAEESMARARAALAAGDQAGAETWARKAQEQFANLNSEVKNGETVLVSAAEANRIAVEGVLAAGKAIEESYLNREAAAERSRLSESARMEQARADISTLEEAMSKIQALEIEASVKDQATPVLDNIQSELAKIKDKTVTVTVRYRKVGDDGLATGGRVPGYAFGGRLPGYSLTDNMMGMIRGKRPIALAGGEDVTNALSSRIIYRDAPWLLPALNKVRTTADLTRIMAKMQGLAGGGRVSESYRFTFATGNQESSITTTSRAEADGLKSLAKALQRQKLVTG